MKRVLRRLRGALGMGLVWGIGGALIGGLIEAILNVLPGPDLFLGVDMWPAALAIPAFLAGVLFSMVLWVTEGRRTFEELRLRRFALWGGAVGLGLGVITGLPVVALLPVTLVCSSFAAGSLAIARSGRKREAVGAGAHAHDRALKSIDEDA